MSFSSMYVRDLCHDLAFGLYARKAQQRERDLLRLSWSFHPQRARREYSSSIRCRVHKGPKSFLAPNGEFAFRENAFVPTVDHMAPNRTFVISVSIDDEAFPLDFSRRR